MLLAAPSPCRADTGTTGEKWVLAGFTKYRDALFIDMKRLACGTDQRAQVWSRITPAEQSRYLKQIRRDLSKINKKPMEFKYLEVLNEIDCRNRQIRYLKVIYFRPDGGVIHATHDNAPAWKSIRSGSLWDGLSTIACQKQCGT